MLNIIKKYSWILLLPLLLACNSDDEDGAIDGANLIGTWSYESSSIEWTIDGKDGIQYLKDELGATDQEIEFFESFFLEDFEFGNLTITFNENNTLSGTSGSESISGTWSLSSDGSKLTIVDEMETTIFDVFELSASRFSFGVEETIVEDLNDDNTDETIVIKAVNNLSKL